MPLFQNLGGLGGQRLAGCTKARDPVVLTKPAAPQQAPAPWAAVGPNYESPAILITEGVHAGSHGPIFWAGHVLEQSAHKWEGVPVTLGHPNVDGANISIRHPQAPAPIGRVVRPRYDPVKKAITATVRISKDVPNVADVLKLREVSVGVFGEEMEDYGEWQGEAYAKCAITMDPDHLALLPAGVAAACSWEDGCGVRTHSKTCKCHRELIMLNFTPYGDDRGGFAGPGSATGSEQAQEASRKAERKSLTARGLDGTQDGQGAHAQAATAHKKAQQLHRAEGNAEAADWHRKAAEYHQARADNDQQQHTQYREEIIMDQRVMMPTAEREEIEMDLEDLEADIQDMEDRGVLVPPEILAAASNKRQQLKAEQDVDHSGVDVGQGGRLQGGGDSEKLLPPGVS